MPANIETVEEMAAFASRRVPAWHGLGTVANVDSLTCMEILELAHMSNWNVRLQSVPKSTPDLTFDKESFYVVRDNPFIEGQKDVLGTVSERYNVFSNENTFGFGDALVNAGTARKEKMSWETAGSIDGGRKIFGSLALEREISIDMNGANDTVKMFLLVVTSHDGSSKLTVLVTPVRVVCQNTLNFALKGADQQFKIKHTASMEDKVQEARDTLNLTEKYIEVFEKTATDLFQTKVTNQQFFEIVKGIHGDTPEDNVKGRTTRWQKKIDEAMELWKDSTQANIAGTAWGAVNALTEQEQWKRGIRKGNTENYLSAGSGLDDVANGARNSILKKVQLIMA
jgi:phage/plasmid-like protein (TIGR03299 family)